MSYKHKRGFTLIELLVVVLIIAILAAVAVSQYNKAVIKSRYAALKNLTTSLAQAQELYYLENNTYSDKIEELTIELPGGKLDTSSDARYDYPWGDCTLDVTGVSVLCRNNLISMGYQVYLKHSSIPNHRFCSVRGNTDPNSIYSQICKSETGRTSYYNRQANIFITWKY